MHSPVPILGLLELGKGWGWWRFPCFLLTPSQARQPVGAGRQTATACVIACPSWGSGQCIQLWEEKIYTFI